MTDRAGGGGSMAGDRLTVCDRDCFHCPYPDCILDDADISPGEWAESTARDKRLQAAERSDREKKIAAYQAAYYQANKEKIAAYQAARRKERRDAEKRRGGDGEADGPGAADAGAGVHAAEAGA